MAFLSRLFKRGDPLAEREEARRQGMRDARRHPLTTFTDPQSRPAFVAEIRARAREQITEVHRRLAARRGELLERALAAREAILLELDRPDLLPDPRPNGSPAPGGAEDAFISIAEARRRRDEARRRDAVRASQDSVRRSGARIEQFAQEWENALLEHDQEVAAVHARAEQLIAAYRSGVMEAHPRREEIPPLWQGEVIAVEPTGDTRLGISAREELVRILTEVETRVTDWHTQILPRALPSLEPPPFDGPAQLSTSPPDAPASPPDPGTHTAGQADPESGDTSPPDDPAHPSPPASAPVGGTDEHQDTAPLRQDATPPGPSRNTREHRRTYPWRAAFGDPSTSRPTAEDHPGQDRPSAHAPTTADQPEPNTPDDTAPGKGRNPGSEGEERRWRR